MKFSAELILNIFDFMQNEGFFREKSLRGRWTPLFLIGDDIIFEIQDNGGETISFMLPVSEFINYEFISADLIALFWSVFETLKDEFDLRNYRYSLETRYMIFILDDSKWQGTITQREVDQIKVATEEAIKASEYGYLLPLIKGVQIQ